jgi:hypothetical protein
MKKPFDSLFWQDLIVQERNKIWKTKEFFLMKGKSSYQQTVLDT